MEGEGEDRDSGMSVITETGGQVHGSPVCGTGTWKVLFSLPLCIFEDFHNEKLEGTFSAWKGKCPHSFFSSFFLFLLLE